MRRWFPLAAIALLVLGWLVLLAERAGRLDHSAGLWLLGVSSTLVITALIRLGFANDLRAGSQSRRAEAEVVETEARYRTLFETLIEGFCIIEVIFDAAGKAVDYRFLEINPAFERQTGLRNAAGTRMRELAPDHEEHWFEIYGRVARTGEPVQFEHEALALGRHFDVRAYRVGGPESRKVGILFNDITDRRRAELALRTSEQRFLALEENSWDAVHLLSPEGIILDESPSVVGVLGYLPEELVGRDNFELVHPDDVERVGSAFAPLTANPGSTATAEVRVRHKDGSWRWMDCVATNLTEHPAVRAIAVNYRDITERKLSEQALRESEERFRFLDNLGEATRVLSDPEQILGATAKMLGEYLRASRCAFADVEADGDRFTIRQDYANGCESTVGSYELSLFGERAVATLCRGDTLILRNVEAELGAGEGAEMFRAIDIGAVVTCPLVREGRLRAMMAVHQTTARDWKPNEIAMVQAVVERCWATVERQAAETRLQQLNLELEHRVADRTQQLESANKELEAFSYSVSHDLRAPLLVVDGFSQAVLEDFGPLLPEEGRRYLVTIRQSALRMGELIDDLLTFARLGRQAMTKHAIDTGALVRQALADGGFDLSDREIELRVGELPASAGDPALLKQVWLNLLSNAFKYTRRREKAVIEIGSIRAEGVDAFFVRDNGSGFDMRHADKLFGVFQRLHRAEEFEGTGVGLAIVQRIVNRHGGRVWAEAAVDRGASFYFTLEEGTHS